MPSIRARVLLVGLSAVAGCLLSACNPFAEPELVTAVPWGHSGYRLVADLHTHSHYSDGGDSVLRLVERAVEQGCEVLAVTDHSKRDGGVRTATPAYFAALAKARRRHPGLILFGGIEWNIPRYGGKEHVGVLVEPARAGALLGSFRERFDDSARPLDQRPDARVAMDWLEGEIDSLQQAVMFYHHPSRKQDTVEQARDDLAQWARASGLMVGFEGAPGHQKDSRIGSYRHQHQTRDRWDPLAAEVGGGWDQLLAQGMDLWGALASSDFHESGIDFAPCAFSRTHVQVPERSAAGVLQGLRAGSFWADHGRILDRLKLVLTHPGLALPAVPGETVRLPGGDGAEVGLVIGRGPGARQAALKAELIGNCDGGGVASMQQTVLAPDQTRVAWPLRRMTAGADGVSCYVRARVRLPQADAPDLMAYTNPIRVLL